MSEITEPDSTGPPADVVAGNVLSPRSNCRNIDSILRVAPEFQEEDPDITLILRKHAYTLARDLSPSTEARTMLQSWIRCHTEGAELDQSQDKTRLLEFYKLYREKHNVENIKALRTKDDIRVLENRKVLATVLEQQYKTVPLHEPGRLIYEESRQNIKFDAAKGSTYNIIPIDDPATTNAITSFPEVRAAISSLKYLTDLPQLTDGIPAADVLDFLQYVFGFQKSSVSNQRENIVILLSDEQSRLSPLERENLILDEAAVKNVFDKTFDNYTNWCAYVKEEPIWKKPGRKEVTKNDRILYISLYYLIWGEAANVRFLPECLCYIFHQMGNELADDIMEQTVAKRAKSCLLGDGTASYLEQVIRPLYDVIALVRLKFFAQPALIVWNVL
ncbi:callose synthase 9 [Tanacetum coccineum]